MKLILTQYPVIRDILAILSFLFILWLMYYIILGIVIIFYNILDNLVSIFGKLGNVLTKLIRKFKK